MLAGLRAVRAELQVPADFPAAVLAEAVQAARSPRHPVVDLRDVPFVTIDPPGARDLDQAVHLERRGSGYRVTYAVADVAKFVRPGGAVDAEAHRRGVTLYAPDVRTPLHPPVLSEGAASLLPLQNRPAIVWRMDLDETGEGRAVEVFRAFVRSRAQLTYAQVEASIDGGVAGMLQLLPEIGRLREEREIARGGMTLPIPQQVIERRGRSFHVEFRAPLPVERWNAQLSLMSGMAAADLMLDAGVGIVRTLPPPDPDAVAMLRRAALALRVDWPEQVSWGELVRTLDPAQPGHAALLARSTSLLRGAGYVAFDDGAVPKQVRHWALAAEYAHVTAPLRRLVDRYAAEVCVEICTGEAVPSWVHAALPALPERMAAAERRAAAYEKAVVGLVEAAVLSGREGETFEGTIVSVDPDGDSGMVQLCEPDVLARVVGPSLPLGEEVRVRLVRADVRRRTVEFALADER